MGLSLVNIDFDGTSIGGLFILRKGGILCGN